MVLRVMVVMVGFGVLVACGTESSTAPGKASVVVEEPPAARSTRASEKVAATREQRVEALRRVLEPRLNRSSADLHSDELPGGRRGIKLQGRFGHATMARRRPDGALETGCFDDSEKAMRFATELDAQ
jgi:hypothetical protein